jgi:hypothetical protein
MAQYVPKKFKTRLITVLSSVAVDCGGLVNEIEIILDMSLPGENREKGIILSHPSQPQLEKLVAYIPANVYAGNM